MLKDSYKKIKGECAEEGHIKDTQPTRGRDQFDKKDSDKCPDTDDGSSTLFDHHYVQV